MLVGILLVVNTATLGIIYLFMVQFLLMEEEIIEKQYIVATKIIIAINVILSVVFSVYSFQYLTLYLNLI